MLVEINSNIFKDGKITFKRGLNVVLGDKQASNSIGKSTLLMIIDFVFGGSTYIEHNKDVITELGHHHFEFVFKFNDKSFYFKRTTNDPNIIIVCTSVLKKIDEWSLTTYNNFLKENYYIVPRSITFRATVSLFSRVWGKHNADVKRPLHIYPKEKNDNTVSRFLNLFNEYDQIIEYEKSLNSYKDSNKVIKKAVRYEYIPKVGKRIYEKNMKEINQITKEVELAKINLVSYTTRITEDISNKAFELQNKKKSFLREKDYFKNRLQRVTKKIESKENNALGFEKLIEFFPEVNLEKLRTIESFHNNIIQILQKEISTVKKEIESNIFFYEEQIKDVDQQILNLVDIKQYPNHLVTKLIELTNQLKNLELENQQYEKQEELKENIKQAEEQLKYQKEISIEKVTGLINAKINEINNKIHVDIRRSPELLLYDNNYEYKTFDNTGTGKAYSNLIILDLAVFSLTFLPILIHDSLLFKNIENIVIENIIDYYNQFQKQIFIAIDEINKFDKNTQEILTNKSVIFLNNNKQLFTKDWREN